MDLQESAARIEQDLLALATPQGRLPGTAGHDAALEFLAGRITDLGLAPYPGPAQGSHRHEYRTRDGLLLTNLLGVVPGLLSDAPPFLLAAHYDSVIAAPSADDNAAAVAVVLEVAARLQAEPLQRDVVIALFDAEEPPYFLGPDMGSNRFVAEAMSRAPAMAVVLDLVGHAVQLPIPGADPDMIFVAGAETAAGLPDALAGLSLPTVAVNSTTIGDFSDYAAFRRAGVPFLFWSCGEWADYHTVRDLPEGVRLGKCARLADDLVAVLRRADRTGADQWRPRDCTDFEVRTLEQVLGVHTVQRLAEMTQVDYRTREGLAQMLSAVRSAMWGAPHG